MLDNVNWSVRKVCGLPKSHAIPARALGNWEAVGKGVGSGSRRKCVFRSVLPT